MSSGDGRTVPLTQEEAREQVLDRAEQALRRRGYTYEPTINEVAEVVGDAVLSASPEVLAAAMGGRLDYLNDSWAVADRDAGGNRPIIVLPPREVSRGD